MSDFSSGDELFATETMAELCARQGRLADAIAIYRRLLTGDATDTRRPKWTERLQTLEKNPEPSPDRDPPPEDPSPSSSSSSSSSPSSSPSPPSLTLPLVVDRPVRSGQLVYAVNRDLVVLAPVNPGAQLLADGNIHVYAPLRGRAVAGAQGCRDVRIFCQRLEAELVGIDSAYLTYEDLPRERLGRPAQVVIEAGRCKIESL